MDSQVGDRTVASTLTVYSHRAQHLTFQLNLLGTPVLQDQLGCIYATPCNGIIVVRLHAKPQKGDVRDPECVSL